jgi:hypothetical protein
MKISCQRRKQDRTLLSLAGLGSVSLRVMSDSRSTEVVRYRCRQVGLSIKP